MKRISFFLCLLFAAGSLSAQDLPAAINGYTFTTLKQIGATSVENQHKSSTCWVYSTNSFLESEVLRLGTPPVDLSEMYIVRAAYLMRAENYVRRQGAAAFGQGAENHDVLNVVRKYGIVPESVYSGFPAGEDKPVHGELE
ncbi:MAG: aminopeptidase, partial [Saprospiraceae bacterium]|nr:aminopeptidase [Saprospiraceae bacterium]